MTDPPSPAPTPAMPPATPPGRGSSWGYTIGFIVLLLAAAGGIYAYAVYSQPDLTPPDELAGLKAYITHVARTQNLKEGYADANNDLVADAPTDPAKFLRVDELGFTVVGSDDPEKAREQWKDFLAALEKGTGKKVRYLDDVESVEDQVRAVADGRLHVSAFNTGQVSAAVNTAGFVPLFCPADADGRYAYEMEILVRADSPVRAPEDLKGGPKTVGLVLLSSNSGGKAPLVVLKDRFGLLPGRDYRYTFSGDHVRSVQDLVGGKYDAVCVANDLLARAVGSGVVRADQFRSIYKSDPFPPLCFGVPHHLPPDLAGKVKAVFAGFSFPGTSVGEVFKSQGKVKFAPVDYAKDWKMVRDVDDALTRLLDAR